MFPPAIKMYVLSLLIVLAISSTNGQDRKISSKLTPGCKECTAYNTLLYVRADGSHDTVHQLWDFTQGMPTVIFIISNLNMTVDINWAFGKPSKIWLSSQPKYSFAIAIDKLVEYNDKLDNGYLDEKCPTREYPLMAATWEVDDLLQTDNEVRLQMRANYMDNDKNGTISVKLDLLPFRDYAVDLPHLIHTANSTLVDVSLVNLTMSRQFNASRFALHLLMVSTDSSTDSMNYTIRKSLDDEHTPGVFEIIEIRTPESSRHKDGGFLQFRPVGYTQPERDVASSTMARVSTFNRTTIPRDSVLQTFYHNLFGDVLVQNMFVSFGDSGDGYYTAHNYTSWSFTIGYGAPPQESFSFFVIMIISIGLGVPVLLTLSGVVYALVRRRRQRNAPQRFLDDE